MLWTSFIASCYSILAAVVSLPAARAEAPLRIGHVLASRTRKEGKRYNIATSLLVAVARNVVLAATMVWSNVHADDLPIGWQVCFTTAGEHYSIAPAVLSAIARTESKLDPYAVHHNTDGSSDVGLMQVNSRWFPALRRAGIESAALYQPCTSIWAGAWILAQTFARHGYTWESIGAYNAGERLDSSSAKRRAAYANQVLRNLAYSSLEQQLHNAPHRSGIADYSLEGPNGRGPGGADQ